MKRLLLLLMMTGLYPMLQAQQIPAADSLVTDSFYWLTPAEVRAVRAGENAPFTRTNLQKKEIRALNLGTDIPMLLQYTPSVVVNSDAGNGIGYTGIRIRGTDATRINITLNGVPFNDAESQGTFFVNLPDFLSSTSSIQIQRGVGTSSAGTGAFGASINFSTHDNQPEKHLELNNSIGSFGSRKHTFKWGSGLRKGFSADLRLSSIQSDGFVDRAGSDLRSFYFSGGFQKKDSRINLTVFSGKEKTYQAWYGITRSDLLAGDRTLNYAGTEKPGTPYENETDNYTQTHYQLLAQRSFKNKWHLSSTLFLTRGKGYYEQYKADESYQKYGLPSAVQGGLVINNADFIRQLWLDNYFFGHQSSLRFQKGNTEWMAGTHLSNYEGNHYGKLIWASHGVPANYRWYDHEAQKKDAAVFVKQQTKLKKHWYLFYDLQWRSVRYAIDGFRNNPGIQIDNSYSFFNPKAGISYRRNDWRAYLSYGKGSKEPNRDDFEAGAGQVPLPEQLHNIELGIERQTLRYSWSATGYYMRYRNQLVLTGKINDVGAYTRTNVPLSYRLGTEWQGQYRIKDWLMLSANLTLSINRVADLEEYIDNYDSGTQEKKFYPRSTLSLSPGCTGQTTLTFIPRKPIQLSLSGRYVGRQYLDNTANPDRSLDAFWVQDLRAVYTLKTKWVKEMTINGCVNNLLNTKYEPNGYTFSYISGGQLTTENYYFPMAGINFMLGVNLRW